MKELENYISSLPQPLPKKEQAELFKKFAKTKDEAIREQLITHNLRLATNVIMKNFSRTKMEIEDLVQIANIAVIRAVDKFNIEKDVEFSTFAVPCIKQELINFLRNQKNKISPISLYEEVIEDDKDDRGGKLLIEFIPDEDESHISYDYQYKEFKKRVNDYVKQELSDREQFVYNALVGNGYTRPQTLKEIGKQMNVTHQMVALIKHRIKDKLKAKFDGQFPEREWF